MDHFLSIFSSRSQPREGNNANSENNNGTATSTTTNNSNITMPAPVYISGLSYPNDAYAYCKNLSTETLPKYSREGEDIEMGMQATKGASRNKARSKTFQIS
jgi:hypothetical protein